MKNGIRKTLTGMISTAALIALVSGCASSPSASAPASAVKATRIVTLTAPMNHADVIQAASDSGQAAGLPDVTSRDSGTGIIEFGQFELPDGQISAQVAILPDQKLQITVKDSPEAEKTADLFRTKLEEKLKTVAPGNS